MVSLTEALAAERQRRKRASTDAAVRREVRREVLAALHQRLTAKSLPCWFFIMSGDEIVVAHTKNGPGPRQRVGSWAVDQELRLVFGEETTEWITSESLARVVDAAVLITARLIVDAKSRLGSRASPDRLPELTA